MTVFQNLKNEPDLISTLAVFEQALKNKINCCRIGIVESYDAETRVAKVTIANKLTLAQNDDGSLVTTNYAPIYAKVLFFGWGDIGITHPVNVGSEGILLLPNAHLTILLQTLIMNWIFCRKIRQRLFSLSMICQSLKG